MGPICASLVPGICFGSATFAAMRMQPPVVIIAEAGVNHNGSLSTAFELIDAAAGAGVDYVKFQTFRADKLVSPSARMASYQAANTGNPATSQLAMLRALELDESAHEQLLAYCEKRGVKFLSTAFDQDSLDYLSKLDLDIFKVPSGEVTNAPYLRKVASFGKAVLLSTGMCTLGEVEAAVGVLLSGLTREQITVLHCNTQYPTPMVDVNLRAMHTLGRALQVKVGYSDHTLGIEVPIAAVAMGARVIEKHFTLSRDLPGPDHRASLEPKELTAMVDGIRNIEAALGNGIKAPTPSESENRGVARKSVHSARALAAGHVLRSEDVIMLRPGTGISPMRLEELLGKSLREPVPAFQLLREADLQ